MKPGIILAIFCIAYPILDGLFNGLFKRFNTANHWVNGTQAVMLACMIGYLSFYNLPLNSPKDLVIEMLEVIFCNLAFRYVLFDPFFDIGAGRKIGTKGTTYLIDKLWNKTLKIGKIEIPMAVLKLPTKAVALWFTILFMAQWIYR